MIPKEKIEAIVSKHANIEKELASGNIDSKNYASKSKEYSELGNIVEIASFYLKIDDEKKDLENLVQAESDIKPVLRIIRPPVRAEIRIERGQPSFIRSAIASGEILVSSGPWRTTGYWWSPDERFAFDHYDIQVDGGYVIRLGFDWIQRVWQIDGIYD